VHVHIQAYQKDIGHAHELAPQCAWAYSWAECWHGEYLCGLYTERPRWDIPAAVLSHSKRMTMGWLAKPLSGICFIWVFCLHLPLAPGLKAAALPLFASLLGSEENDNNEAWRLSTASHTHTQTFTLLILGTQTTLQMQTHTASLTLCYSRHTYIHIYTHTHTHTYTHTQCEMNAGRHNARNYPHFSSLYLQFTAKSSFNIVLYASVLYFILILSSWLKILYCRMWVFVLFVHL